MGLRAAELLAMYQVDESGLDKSLAGIPGKVAGMAAKIGGAAAIGGALMASLDQDRLNDKLAAQLGAPADYAADLGRIAGHLYAGAYGDSLGQVNDALKSVLQNGLLPEDATNAQIEAITAKVMDLSTTFDQDLGGATNAVAQMIRTGLAKNADEALDILTRGFQQGDDKAGDLLDTMNEYGTQFRKLGIDGTTATGLISQGLKAGARDSDIVADAIKEFAIRAVDGSELTAQSFQAIGLNARDMSEKIARGGPEAQAALGQVLDGLRGVEDPAQRAQIAIGLFGTQAEDMGAALYALDPSTAVQAMGDVAGAADRMGQTLNDNASTNLESFKRQATQAFVNLLGGYVLPVLAGVTSFLVGAFGPAVKAVGGFIAGTLVPALQSAAQWISNNQTPIMIVAGLIAAVFIPHLIALGVQSLIAGAKTVAGWVLGQAGAIAAAAVHSASIVAMVAGWVLLGVQSLIQGARMAAAWVLAMGPVGWVIAAVVGLVALIVANWKTVVSWTRTAWSAVTGAIGAAWNWIKGAVSAALGFLVNLFLNFTGPGLIIKHWQSIVNFTRQAWSAVTGVVSGAWRAVTGAVSNGVGAALDLVRSLPGRILGALGNLGSLLWNAGANMIQGLINGAGSLLRNIGRFFLNLVPGWIRGPFEAALGISSPSKVFAGYGENIGQGLIRGMAGMRPAVAAEMLRLADTQALNGITARVPAGATTAAGTVAPGAGGSAAADGGGRGPLFHADSVTVIEGTPRDVARELELGARTRGHW